jgi:hypothetical protein
MHDKKGPEQVLRENWGRASRTTLTAAAVLFLLSRGQKAAPSEIMKAVGLDWSALNPYAIGLFGGARTCGAMLLDHLVGPRFCENTNVEGVV